MNKHYLSALKILNTRGVVKLTAEQTNALTELSTIAELSPIEMANEVMDTPAKRIEKFISSSKKVAHKVASKLAKALED